MSGSGAVFFLFAAIVVGIRIVGRRIPDRLGAKRASGSALVLLALGLLTIGLWNEPAGLFVGTAVFASGQALAFPALLMLAVGGSTDHERSSVVGTFTAFADIGFSLGALTLGAVASLGGYDAVFLVCACSSVVGGLLLARIPQPPRVRTADAS